MPAFIRFMQLTRKRPITLQQKNHLLGAKTVQTKTELCMQSIKVRFYISQECQGLGSFSGLF